METKYTEAALDVAQYCIDRWGTLRDVAEGLRRDIAENFVILTPELRLEEGDDNCVEIADSWVSPHAEAAKTHVFFDLDGVIEEEDYSEADRWHRRSHLPGADRSILSFDQKLLSVVLLRLAQEQWEQLRKEADA